jgi:hypothetical protein
MDFREKQLYHQIHPAKLFTDWSTGFIALYFLWQHNLVVALVIMFVPAITVSLLMVRYLDLEKYKQSPFGRYVRVYMARFIEMVRLAGYLVLALGAWYHVFWLIPLGVGIVLLGWLRGVLLPERVFPHMINSW